MTPEYTYTVVEPVAVTVCGPNLSAYAYEKGNLHVHATGCADLRHYGHGGRFGGEKPWDIEVTSLAELNDVLYGDFANDAGVPTALYVTAYGVDHWLAPCASKVLK